jgi:hypothetical protein
MCTTEQQRQFYAKHGDKWAEYMRNYRKSDPIKHAKAKAQSDKYNKRVSEYNKLCRTFRNINI